MASKVVADPFITLPDPKWQSDVKILKANGNSVACLFRWKAAQPVGTILDVENIDVYTIENGLIVQVKVYSADLELEVKFWGK